MPILKKPTHGDIRRLIETRYENLVATVHSSSVKRCDSCSTGYIFGYRYTYTADKKPDIYIKSTMSEGGGGSYIVGQLG